MLYGLSIAITLASNSRIKETKRLLKIETGKDLLLSLDLLMTPQKGLMILTNTLPELDFPLKAVPNIIACGPILRSSPSVKQADKELSEWLAAGPTVYINLGTHFLTSEHLAIEMAKSIRMLFDAAVSKRQLPGLRVLWKLKQPPDALYSTGQKSKVYQILSKEIEQGVIRIQSWIAVEPEALLESGHIICSVNHGGASSFNEGVWYVLAYGRYSRSQTAKPLLTLSQCGYTSGGFGSMARYIRLRHQSGNAGHRYLGQ